MNISHSEIPLSIISTQFTSASFSEYHVSELIILFSISAATYGISNKSKSSVE